MKELRAEITTFFTEFADLCAAFLEESFGEVRGNPGTEYLEKRCISSQELLSKNDVGYFDTLARGNDFSDRYRKLEGEFSHLKSYLTQRSPSRLQAEKEIGPLPCLYGPAGNNIFQRRIVFPIYNLSGELINMYGRSVDEDSPTPHVYASAVTCWYNLNREDVQEANSLAVVEGVFDAFTLIQAGIKSTTALCCGQYQYGALHEFFMRSHFFKWGLVGQLRKLKKLETVYLCFDNDCSNGMFGSYHAVIVGKLLSENGFSVRIVHFPKDKDPNSMFVDEKTDEQSRIRFFQERYEELVGESVDYFVEQALLELKELGLSDPH
ncbi:MAG: toprim domain-containing protein, partial [Pseudomonadota bacterium]